MKTLIGGTLRVIATGIVAGLCMSGSLLFAVKERAARTGRNPQTGKEITIAAAKVPSFRVSE